MPDRLLKNMKDETQLQFGLQPTPYDPRDFPLGGVFGGVKPEDIPNVDFMVSEPLEIKDQGRSDFCTGYSLASVSEDQEGVMLDSGFVFTLIKRYQGNWKSWGGDLRSGCKVATKIGFIELGQNPMDFGAKPRDFIANWNNWPLDHLLMLAEKHRKESYFAVDGPYDTFDNLRSALYTHRADKSSIYTGCTWKNGWLYTPGGVIPKTKFAGGVGHAFKVCGQKIINGVPHLVVQNSFGEDVGDHGLHYFPREVVNRDFNFGAYMFKDMPREDAEAILANKGLLVEQPPRVIKSFESPFWNFIKRFFS